jgi:hypothetical protein
MPRGGPEHWSNECAHAPALRLAAATSVPRTHRLVVGCVIVAVATGGILTGGFKGRVAWAQTGQQPSVKVAPILRAEPASRVRLPIQVGPPHALAKNSFIRIRGLPPAAALSDGYSIAPGAWAVPLVALPTLSIILPAGSQNESSVTITLVSVEGQILVETSMVLTVAPPVPDSTPGQAFRPGAAPLLQSSSERERVLALHAKGIEQLERGNVFAARKFFERAVEGGLAQSAVALAGTYDPDELAKMKVVGLQPNVEEARKWYEKARELGAFEAVERLRRLGTR